MSEPEQRSLFELDTSLDPLNETWSQVVARRMQAMVMAYPIHQLVAKGESNYYPDWQEQNFTFLALQLFDSVFARMAPGLGRGATRVEIIHDLTPFILARQESLSEPQIEALVDFILNQLMNEGRGSFEHECVWIDEGNVPKPYAFRYGLLKSYHDPETDQFIIRATGKAIHLYLRMLDHPIEDEQISNLFVLYEQVRRGRISQTRREAERTKLLSLQYERYIEDMLRTVRRDVRSVDWIREVAPKIGEAHVHVQRLIHEQGRVLRELKAELYRSEDLSRVKAIRDLTEVLETCQRRHMELQKRILAAGPAYLEEQAYQRFRRMARLPMPDLNQQVFLPALTIEEPHFMPMLPALFHGALGPRIHRFLDLEVWVDRLLRDEGPMELPTDEEELEDRLPVSEQFDPIRDELEEKIAEILTRIKEKPVRLSAVLEYGRAEGMDLAELGVIGVTLLHSYHARSDLLGFRVIRDGTPLSDPDFMGDDLLISRQDEKQYRPVEQAHAE